MPSYTAPVEDMMFLFEKLRDNKKYNELEKYKEVSSDLVKDILEEAAKINQKYTRKKIIFFSMPNTLYDKIWIDHLVDQQDDGTALLFVDRHTF